MELQKALSRYEAGDSMEAFQELWKEVDVQVRAANTQSVSEIMALEIASQC